MDDAIGFFRRVPEVELDAVLARNGRSRTRRSECGLRIELDLSDVVLRRNVQRSSAGKLGVAAAIPIPMQADAAKIGALADVEQSGGLGTVERTVPEGSGLPGNNDSVIAAGSAACALVLRLSTSRSTMVALHWLS